MLEDLGVNYAYREYRDDPLSETEITRILKMLGLSARELLRPKESQAHGVTGDMDEQAIVSAMAKEPTLIQRPICIDGDRALLARPAEQLKDFLR